MMSELSKDTFANYPDVVDIKLLCEMLMVGRNTAYDLVNSNTLPYKRIGRQIRISKKAIIEYLEMA